MTNYGLYVILSTNTMDIKRAVYPRIIDHILPNKAVVLLGPRRVGKTYLLNKLVEEYGKKEIIKFDTGENKFAHGYLASRSIERLKEYVGSATLLIIDEAQKVPDIGLNLKLIVDHLPGVKVVVSGSSSFDLNRQVGEPLTGRKITLKVMPIWAGEVIDNFGLDYQHSLMAERLVFGSYPEALLKRTIEEKTTFLRELTDSYLLKDVLELEGLRKSNKIVDLLTLLAYQIGNEVSLSELGASLGLNRGTVERYLDLLEKVFVIVNIRGFSRNLRKEVTKTSRYYFYDNGVRNALINNFNPLNLRDDLGMLWENYIVMERLKKQAYAPIHTNNYFWRTWDQKEIDWVEMREGRLFGYEISYAPKKSSRAEGEWLKTYKEAELNFVDKENYLGFIT